MMPFYLETMQDDIRFAFHDAGLLFGNGDLLLGGIDAFKIRQQQPSVQAFLDDDAVFFGIQCCDAVHRFRFSQNIDTDFQILEFGFLNR